MGILEINDLLDGLITDLFDAKYIEGVKFVIWPRRSEYSGKLLIFRRVRYRDYWGTLSGKGLIVVRKYWSQKEYTAAGLKGDL